MRLICKFSDYSPHTWEWGCGGRSPWGPGLWAQVPCSLRGGNLWGLSGELGWGLCILTHLSLQAPSLQQYRTSAGTPANQSPTSPVSNQGFSPGSSPQVRDVATHAPVFPCTPVPLPTICASCLTSSHLVHSTGLGG